MTEAQLNALSKKVIGAALDLHRELGPGLDEVGYEQALSLSLMKAGIANEWQVPLPIVYKGSSSIADIGSIFSSSLRWFWS